jgi:hypothetical protein
VEIDRFEIGARLLLWVGASLLAYRRTMAEEDILGGSSLKKMAGPAIVDALDAADVQFSSSDKIVWSCVPGPVGPLTPSRPSYQCHDLRNHGSMLSETLRDSLDHPNPRAFGTNSGRRPPNDAPAIVNLSGVHFPANADPPMAKRVLFSGSIAGHAVGYGGNTEVRIIMTNNSNPCHSWRVQAHVTSRQ